jgi:hypothetical protein
VSEPAATAAPASDDRPVPAAASRVSGSRSDAANGRRRLLGWLAVPLVIYVATRLVQLAVVAWMLPPGGSVRERLVAWDGGWFIRVARDGYPPGYEYGSGGQLVGNGLAFFPGYPALIRLAHVALGLDYATAALAVSWLAGAAAAVLVHALGVRLYDRRVAAVLTVLFCAQPMSLVLSMAYSEGLFVALVAGMLLAAHARAWLTAGALGIAAGLTRPTGAAAAVALAVAVALHLAGGRARRGRWRAVVGAVGALLAVPAYLVWVGWRAGDPTAWFTIQAAGWGSRFDFGAATARFTRDALRAGEGWVHVSTAWLLIAAVVAAVLAVRAVWPPLVAYGLIALVLVVGQAGYYHSKPRLLVPVLLVLVPAAVALGRARWRTAAPILVGYALFGLWYGAYLITVWKYAI